MRRLALLLLLVPSIAAEDTPRREHDELGFPITFNDEIITRNDVLRGLGVAEARLGSLGTLRTERNRVLRLKIMERIGALHGIQIADEEVELTIRREVDVKGGEAKFYEYLAQRGQSLERYKQTIRTMILQRHIAYMLARGYTPAKKLLPWSLRPTPREIGIAFRNDKARLEGGVKVSYYRLVFDVDRKTRRQLAAQRALGKSEAWIQGQIEKRVRPEVESVLADLKAGRRTVTQVAEEREVALRGPEELPSAESADPVVRFLAGAEPGDYSEPLPRTGGGLLLIGLVKTEKPGTRGLDDPALLHAYRSRIHDLRARKAEALLQLEALDRSSIRPERVKGEFRGTVLASLREAETNLRLLGLH